MGDALSAFRRVPPHKIIPDFFSPGLVARLVDYALANEQRFEAAKIRRGVDLSYRRAARLSDLGALLKDVQEPILNLLPELLVELGVSPFVLSYLETELVAHGDGAFFQRHIDTATGEDTGKHQRILSAVYYFRAGEKAFTGGALRLFGLGAATGLAAESIDIEPEHNQLVVFPSYALHEVLPVSCPSRQFADSRFAINCWMCRAGS